MESAPLTDSMSFNNILYIGDDARECLKVIEKFNTNLLEIERHYTEWFRNTQYGHLSCTKLQRHIHYHFEGGIAIFKFRNEDEIPETIRRECLIACRNLVFEQHVCAS